MNEKILNGMELHDEELDKVVGGNELTQVIGPDGTPMNLPITNEDDSVAKLFDRPDGC